MRLDQEAEKMDDLQSKELQIYQIIDNQPFFRHYVQEVLRLNQDLTHHLNEKGIELPLYTVEAIITIELS